MNAYHNRVISTREVLEELIQLAKEMDAAVKRGEALGLTDDELAFYDALAAKGSAASLAAVRTEGTTGPHRSR